MRGSKKRGSRIEPDLDEELVRYGDRQGDVTKPARCEETTEECS